MPHVVIIDDQSATIEILSHFLKQIKKVGDVTCRGFTDEIEAMQWLRSNEADLILLDYRLNKLTGLDVISFLRMQSKYHTVPIVMVTEFDERDIRYRSLDAGATDFLAKPVDRHECVARCTNLLMLRDQQIRLEHQNRQLSEKVEQSLSVILQRERDTLHHLARAGEYRDSDTGNHIIRIAKYSRVLAETLDLSAEMCEVIEHASPMHDVGKIGIPDNILLKPDKLTEHELRIMRQHTLMGHKILSGSKSKYMTMGATIALHHHEKFDGTGYPYGLSGVDIPIEARIVAVADVFDALTTVRPYKGAWSFEDALQHLSDGRNQHFDPEVIDAFEESLTKIRTIYQNLQDAIPDDKASAQIQLIQNAPQSNNNN